MPARMLLLAAVACVLCGCIAQTEVRRLQPGIYEITRTDCGFPTDAGTAQRLRPELERAAAAHCTRGYDLDEPELSLGDMRGSAFTGECPTTVMRAVVRCRAAAPRDSLPPL